MKLVIGILMVIVGVMVGLYVGLWLCFIGGIVNLIEAVRSENLIAMDVVIGVAKIVCAGAAGSFSAFVLCIPGFLMIKDS